MEKLIAGPVMGYKGTDKYMRCRGVQYKMGMNELDNSDPLRLCKNGIHFCTHISGPFCYVEYDRLFRVAAYDVLDVEDTPGAIRKLVCRKIEFLEEIKIEGLRNTGNGNIGDYNTGDCNVGGRNAGNGNTGDWNIGNMNVGDKNTGHQNTGNGNTGDENRGELNTGDNNTGRRNTGDENRGDWNAGSGNIGDWNVGYQNTGNGNTGDKNKGNFNTGHQNTGYWNTGHLNTGYWNTGDWNRGNCNTGDYNTGNGNAGNGNATDFCSGYFCKQPQPIMVFDEPYSGDRKSLNTPTMLALCKCLMSDEDFDVTPFLGLPNATAKKIKALHKAHKKQRAKLKKGQ